MKTEFDLTEQIELWKLRFGIAVSQSPKFKELDGIIKEFIKRLLTPNNISKGFVEVSTIKYYAGENLI